MSEKFDAYSRLDRFEKKRKNTKWLTILIGIGVILCLIFVGYLIFTGGNDENQEESLTNNEQSNNAELHEDEESQESEGEQNEVETEPEEETQETEEQDPIESNQDNEDVQLESVESEDEIVIEAYTGNWAPIPTSQEEPHEIIWEQSSTDWQEMLKAAEKATNVAPDDMDHLWVSGNGPQSVIATFSNNSETDHYRVYITWVENQGWKPTKVELLSENDQEEKIESSEEDTEEETTETE